jgi:hypothetical protein
MRLDADLFLVGSGSQEPDFDPGLKKIFVCVSKCNKLKNLFSVNKLVFRTVLRGTIFLQKVSKNLFCPPGLDPDKNFPDAQDCMSNCPLPPGGNIDIQCRIQAFFLNICTALI